MKIHRLITTTEALTDICSRLAHADFICVDTEFMRENTYWPELCLIQIADTKEAAAIDPLAPGIDLKPLLDLLVDNEDVLKIFHAGGQDVEIIYNLTGKTPHPIFDTQIAMMAISQNEQIGYSNLVEAWLGLTIDKGAREIDAASRLLARSDDLELLAAGVRKNLPILEGWRFGVFGKDALDLVEGKLAFAVVKGRLRMTHIDDIHEEMREQEAAREAEDDGDMPTFAEPEAEEPDAEA